MWEFARSQLDYYRLLSFRGFERGWYGGCLLYTSMKIPHFIYKKYPRLRVVLSKRCRSYNEQLDLVEQLEDKGRIVVDVYKRQLIYRDHAYRHVP